VYTKIDQPLKSLTDDTVLFLVWSLIDDFATKGFTVLWFSISLKWTLLFSTSHEIRPKIGFDHQTNWNTHILAIMARIVLVRARIVLFPIAWWNVDPIFAPIHTFYGVTTNMKLVIAACYIIREPTHRICHCVVLFSKWLKSWDVHFVLFSVWLRNLLAFCRCNCWLSFWMTFVFICSDWFAGLIDFVTLSCGILSVLLV